MLLERTTELGDSLSETNQNWLGAKRDFEHLDRWVKLHKLSLDDYEGALRESDLTYPEEITKEFPQGTKILTRHVQDLVQAKKHLTEQNRNLSKEMAQLRFQFDGATQKYMLDVEEKKTNLAVAEERLAAADDLTKALQQQLSQLQKENLRLTLKSTRGEDESRRQQERFDEERTNLSAKTLSQLKCLREQFESDRLELNTTIDRLQKDKMALQSEVGQLLRDRRSFASSHFQRDPRLAKY
ncbi:hypothetical protein HDU91_006159, partial [Kappamyces sp. JEL0680]